MTQTDDDVQYVLKILLLVFGDLNAYNDFEKLCYVIGTISGAFKALSLGKDDIKAKVSSVIHTNVTNVEVLAMCDSIIDTLLDKFI